MLPQRHALAGRCASTCVPAALAALELVAAHSSVSIVLLISHVGGPPGNEDATWRTFALLDDDSVAEHTGDIHVNLRFSLTGAQVVTFPICAAACRPS